MTDNPTDAELNAPPIEPVTSQEPWGWPTREADETELNALLTDLANTDPGPWGWKLNEGQNAELDALLTAMAAERPSLEETLADLDAETLRLEDELERPG